MDQLQNLADNRLINGCIYCDGAADTRDHIPSRTLLDKPLPENLPVIGCCNPCNQGFSKDEEYVACFIEAVLAGSTEPEKIARASIARTLKRSPALRTRIESAKVQRDDRTEFRAEQDRIVNVMLKLARGHAAFELNQPCRERPDHFWCGPLEAMSSDVRDSFNAPHFQHMLGEIGSRGIQRLLVIQAAPGSSKAGEKPQPGLLLNDWVEVQEGNYRYLAIDDVGGVVIRIVIREYLACEVAWRTDK